MRYVATILFYLICGSLVVPWTIALTLAWPLPHRYRFALVPSYGRTMMWFLKVLCGVDMKVEGKEQLPDEPCVVLLKHSSLWETIAELMVFPRQVIVLKRELMWVPILGWALASMRSISIDRTAGRSAVKQILDQGKEHLAEGTWVMIFPEGTRVPKGRMGRWGRGGPLLAVDAGVPVIPVAHNAADHWVSGKMLKVPGTITLRIGPVIRTEGRSAEDVADEARRWMDNAMLELSTHHQPTYSDGTLMTSETA